MALIVTTDDNFRDVFAANANRPVFLYFSASWCRPCKEICPLIDELISKHDGKFTVIKIDIDDCPDITDEYKIDSVPSVLLIIEGKIIETITGADDKAIRAVFDKKYTQ